MPLDPNKNQDGLDASADRDITAEIDQAEWEGVGHSGTQNESSDSDDGDSDGDGDGDGGE